MTLQQQYARALYDLVSLNPSKASDYLHNIQALLIKKGYQKVFPEVFTEFKKLDAQNNRLTNAASSPQAKRTRYLLELYRKLVQMPL